MNLAQANQIVLGIGNFDSRTKMLLIKALREAWAAGENTGRAALDGEVEYRRGYAQAMKDAEEEFQQRAIDYVVGCINTADEIVKRVGH